MNSKIIAAIAVLAAIGLGALFSKTRQELAVVRAESDAMRATNMDLAQRVSDLQASRVEPKELERMRADQRDAIRVRGEVTKLQQEATAARAAATQAAAQAARATAPAAPQQNQPNTPGVRTFSLQARGAVPPGATMTVGGWETKPGVHTFALITPVYDGTSVTLQTRWVEGPREVVSALNEFGQVISRGARLLTPEQSTAFLAALEQTAQVDFLASPTTTTAPGREAEISVGSQMQGPDGNMIHVGPQLTLTPNVGADGSIDLSASARVTVPTAPPAPAQ